MKIILDIDEGLAANIVARTGERLDLQDGYHLNVESTGQVIINITTVVKPADKPADKPTDKPMHAGGKSGASGSLSFA